MSCSSNMHVRWADSDGSSPLIVSNDDELHNGQEDTEISTHSTVAVVDGSLHECTPPLQIRRRLPRTGHRGAARPHTMPAATMMGSHGRDYVKDPQILRHCQQQPMTAVDITASADNVNKSAEHDATAAVTAPAHDSFSVLSPDKSVAVILRRSNRESTKDECNHHRPPSIAAFSQSESRVTEPHPDLHDRSNHAADAALQFSRVTPSTPSISEAAEQSPSCHLNFIKVRGQRQAWHLFSPVSTTGAPSFLSPSSAAFFPSSSSGGGCSPGFREPHVVFSAKNEEGSELSLPSLCKHTSAASYQPRTKCGCCGVSVQVRVAETHVCS